MPLVLHAKADDGRTGEWAGGLFVSPGASGLVAKDLYAPDENVTFDVIVPTVRTTAYVEIDDAQGRAWGAAVPIPPSTSSTPQATVTGPKLAPGLYWIAAAGDASGTAALGPGSIARPFFVGRDPIAALAFGTDPDDVRSPGRRARQPARRVRLPLPGRSDRSPTLGGRGRFRVQAGPGRDAAGPWAARSRCWAS